MIKDVIVKAFRIGFTGLAGAIILVASSEALRAGLSSQAIEIKVAQAPVPNVTGNCNNFGNNNFNCNTLNIGPQKLVFSDQLGRDLLEKMPTKKKVVIRSIGGNYDQAVASEIQMFLQKNGYDVQRTLIGMLVPPPDNKISLRDSLDGYVLTIAPSAN